MMDGYDFCLHMKITMLTSQDFTGNKDLVENLDCKDFEGNGRPISNCK